MIPIYVISLASDTERRARMAAQLDSLGLAFRFLDGVDGRVMTLKAREQAAPSRRRRYWSRLTGGEIGCALSHIVAMQTIAAGPDPVVVLLEDDVTIPRDFPQFLAELERNPPPFDMMWLAQSPPKKHRAILPVGELGGRQIRARVYLDYTAAAMIYTRDAARRLAGTIKVVVAPIDHMLWRNSSVLGLRVVEVHPHIIEQDMDGPSTIQDRQVNAIGIRARYRREVIRYINMVRRWCSFIAGWGPAAALRLRRAGGLHRQGERGKPGPASA
ncbi:MAG: glycosyltransferase family 25 protein [Bradyrhizobiaceae bacterium]|nr:glycosyltransferase family 25 protein [Bradyrhizobiaceae bacterium]